MVLEVIATPTLKEKPKETKQAKQSLDRLQSTSTIAKRGNSASCYRNGESVVTEGIMRLGESLVTGKAAFEGFGVLLFSSAFASMQSN